METAIAQPQDTTDSAHAKLTTEQRELGQRMLSSGSTFEEAWEAIVAGDGGKIHQAVWDRLVPAPVVQAPSLVFIVEKGGIVDVTANMPIKVMVIDYDRGDDDSREKSTSVDIGEGRTEMAIVSLEQPEIIDDYVNQRIERYEQTQGTDC